jgi:hypothetical protein
VTCGSARVTYCTPKNYKQFCNMQGMQHIKQFLQNIIVFPDGVTIRPQNVAVSGFYNVIVNLIHLFAWGRVVFKALR